MLLGHGVFSFVFHVNLDTPLLPSEDENRVSAFSNSVFNLRVSFPSNLPSSPSMNLRRTFGAFSTGRISFPDIFDYYP